MRRSVVAAILLAAPIGAQSTRPAGPKETGTWPKVVEEFFAHGAPKVRYSLNKDGQRVGEFVSYYPNGKIRIRARYEKGELHGQYLTYYSGGERELLAHYRLGKLHGKLQSIRLDGNNIQLAEYREGVLHGRRELFDGQKTLSRQEYRNGLLVTLDGLDKPLPKDAASIRKTFAHIATLGPDPDPWDKNPPDAKLDPHYPARVAALNRLRQYRYLCDLPFEQMTLNPRWIKMCDAAADICTRNGGISHTPKNPGVDAAYFALAAQGARSSNLSTSPDMIRSVDMYMDDSDPRNIARVGHRQHCLDPRMLVTAFGTADGASAMWSFDRSRSNAGKIDAVYYPPRGLTPVQCFQRHAAFSVMMNAAADKADVKAVIWPLDEDYIKARTPLKTDYLNVVNGGGGLSFGTCVIFRSDAFVAAEGRRYLVDLSLGGDRKLTWLVEFFKL